MHNAVLVPAGVCAPCRCTRMKAGVPAVKRTRYPSFRVLPVAFQGRHNVLDSTVWREEGELQTPLSALPTVGDDMKVRPGEVIQLRDLVTVNDHVIAVPDPTRLTHLQFRRFAGCPICSLHLQSVAARSQEIATAGIHEVVLFHSTQQELRTYAGNLPLDVVADPDKQFYKKFGVETSLRGVLDPRAFTPVLKAMVRRAEGPRLSAKTPAHPTGGRLGLPADILIDQHGTILACKYGSHADDQWSVDELLQFAALRP